MRLERQQARVKKGEAMDDSGLSNACIKALKEDAISCITGTIQKIVENTEGYPSKWKRAQGLTLHKKGDRETLTNYRLLCISSTRPNLENHYGPEQHGFRKGHSTGSLLHILEAVIHNSTTTKK